MTCIEMRISVVMLVLDRKDAYLFREKRCKSLELANISLIEGEQ
jgi:hypothetical protein